MKIWLNGFNSRTPCGVRLVAVKLIFQWQTVSIHAPRAGCDLIPLYCQGKASMFQFTHPVRGATAMESYSRKALNVSIHAPRAGCDTPQPHDVRDRDLVSIHAPRAGCDTAPRDHEMRSAAFQFTHPVRGATLSSPDPPKRSMFQFTHPVRGATSIGGNRRLILAGFNSRTPCGVRRWKQRGAWAEKRVSIHAPRAGCDICLDFEVFHPTMFQFTHPVRGATAMLKGTHK